MGGLFFTFAAFSYSVFSGEHTQHASGWVGGLDKSLSSLSPTFSAFSHCVFSGEHTQHTCLGRMGDAAGRFTCIEKVGGWVGG